MSDQTTGPEHRTSQLPRLQREIEKLEERKKMERVANKAAEQAGKTETRYNKAHDIFRSSRKIRGYFARSCARAGKSHFTARALRI